MERGRTDEIWAYNAEQAWIVVVKGDLDTYSSRDLRACLERALADSSEALLVDLEEVTFMDAASVGILVAAFKEARANGASLRLVAPSTPAERVLRLTQTENLFPIDTDLITAYGRVVEPAAHPQRVKGFDDAA